VDCTSNQVGHPVCVLCGADKSKAIAFFEVSRPLAGQSLLHHESLIAEAIRDAREALKGLQGSATFEEFVVEILV
jgi:hypothetical protein